MVKFFFKTLQVIDGLNILDKEGTRLEKDVFETPLLETSATCSADIGSRDINKSVLTVECSEEMRCIHEDRNLSESCHNIASETDASDLLSSSKEIFAAIDKAQILGNVEANMTSSGIPPVAIEDVNQESSCVTLLAIDDKGIREDKKSKIRAKDEGTKVDRLSLDPPGEVSGEKYSNMEVDTDKTGEEATEIDPPSLSVPDKASGEKDNEMELDSNLVTLKPEAISPVSDEQGGSSPEVCVKSEKAQESEIDYACKEDSENLVENKGMSEGIIQPSDKQESDVKNCEGQAEEKDELGKTAELKGGKVVPHEDEIVQLPIKDVCAAQPSDQSEKPVFLIPDEDFANSSENVDSSLDPETKTGTSNSKPGHMSGSEDLKLEAASVTCNEKPAYEPPISKPKSNDDALSDFGATIINHCQKGDDVAIESLNLKIKTINDESLNVHHKSSASKSCINETVVITTREQGSSTTCQEGAKSYVFLPNCQRNQEISKRMAQKLLTSLMR